MPPRKHRYLLLRALGALAALAAPSFAEDASGSCAEVGDSHTALLQLGQRASAHGGARDAEIQERPGIVLEELLADDGSQVSAPGPPLALEDAVAQLGNESALGITQQNHDERDAARRGLDAIAVVYVSGRTRFDDALRQAVLQYAPMGEIFKTNGKTPDNFVEALDHAFSSFPNASWYYLADDDSFVHLERLAKLASTYDAASHWYIGVRRCNGWFCPKKLVKCQRETMVSSATAPGWATGGPGILISRPLVKSMVGRRCAEYYGRKRPAPVCCGDLALACCAWDVWGGLQITHVEALLSPGNRTALMMPEHSPQPLVAVHHLKPETTLQLGKLYNSHLAS